MIEGGVSIWPPLLLRTTTVGLHPLSQAIVDTLLMGTLLLTQKIEVKLPLSPRKSETSVINWNGTPTLWENTKALPSPEPKPNLETDPQ